MFFLHLKYGERTFNRPFDLLCCWSFSNRHIKTHLIVFDFCFLFFPVFFSLVHTQTDFSNIHWLQPHQPCSIYRVLIIVRITKTNQVQQQYQQSQRPRRTWASVRWVHRIKSIRFIIQMVAHRLCMNITKCRIKIIFNGRKYIFQTMFCSYVFFSFFSLSITTSILFLRSKPIGTLMFWLDHVFSIRLAQCMHKVSILIWFLVKCGILFLLLSSVFFFVYWCGRCWSTRHVSVTSGAPIFIAFHFDYGSLNNKISTTSLNSYILTSVVLLYQLSGDGAT